MNWEAIGSTILPLADSDREWDGDKARKNIFKWAGGGDDFDQRKVHRAFFAYDADKPENQTSYKLPFADVINGDLQAVPNALQSVAGILEGARGGVDLPDTVISEIRDKVEKYYDKMDKEVPW